jgi:hypothetical protein
VKGAYDGKVTSWALARRMSARVVGGPTDQGQVGGALLAAVGLGGQAGGRQPGLSVGVVGGVVCCSCRPAFTWQPPACAMLC